MADHQCPKCGSREFTTNRSYMSGWKGVFVGCAECGEVIAAREGDPDAELGSVDEWPSSRPTER
jgi:uncharacterized Zn finger protein